MWRTIRGERIADLRAFVSATLADGERRVDIGTDSIVFGKSTLFVTVITLLRPGKGGRAVYRREVRPRMRSLRERLVHEVWLSVSLALELGDLWPSALDLTIHVDANPSARHRSSRHVHELVAMVVSQGFRVAIKPLAWAATCAADRVARDLVARATRRGTSGNGTAAA